MHTSAQRTRSLPLFVPVLAVVLACALFASDPRVARAGDDANGDFSPTGSVTTAPELPQWLKAMNARGDALNRKYGLGKYARNTSAAIGGRVTVRVAGANDGRDVGDGSLAGTGHFTAVGAITDKGKSLVYRTKKGALIILRYVTVGEKGTITFVVRIDTILATSRWTITSGTKAYKGLHGKGTEHENAQYTVSTLTGSVSH